MSDKDRPGGILEIPASLSRDIEKAEQGKIAPPPIEAFLSDEVASEVEAATRVNDTPIHAETLRPITRAEANLRTTLDGKTLQNMPAPRRVIPPPFQRQRVVGGQHGKSWQNLRADQVKPGDIIPDIGRVKDAHEILRRETVAGKVGVASRIEWVVRGIDGAVAYVSPETQLRVFR